MPSLPVPSQVETLVLRVLVHCCGEGMWGKGFSKKVCKHKQHHVPRSWAVVFNLLPGGDKCDSETWTPSIAMLSELINARVQ